jgi:hypothetical protein
MTSKPVMPASEPASIPKSERFCPGNARSDIAGPRDGLRRSGVSVAPAMTRMLDCAVRRIGSGAEMTGQSVWFAAHGQPFAN